MVDTPETDKPFGRAGGGAGMGRMGWMGVNRSILIFAPSGLSTHHLFLQSPQTHFHSHIIVVFTRSQHS
jgi:hypothetical protein